MPAPRLSVPHALGGRRLAPSLVAPSWLGLARPALTLAAGWPRCVVVGLSHSAATPASAASSQRSVRGPGCPRFFSSPGGAHTSVRPCLAPPSLRVLSANYSPECAHLSHVRCIAPSSCHDGALSVHTASSPPRRVVMTTEQRRQNRKRRPGYADYQRKSQAKRVARRQAARASP